MSDSTAPWTCTTCGDTVTEYRPGAFGPDGETPCAPCHNRAEAALLPPEVERWAPWLGVEGECSYCGRDTHVRTEPFGQRESCKDCFGRLIETTEAS